MTPRQRRI